MIACFTLGNSINGSSISTCHHTMSKFQCSNCPSPYFLTLPCKIKPLCKNASHSGTLSPVLLARATILCQIGTRLETTWMIFCLQLIVCTKPVVVLPQPATIHCQANALKSQDVQNVSTSVTISKYSIILMCPKQSQNPQFPHVPHIQYRNFH